MFVVCGEALLDVFEAGETATGLTLDARIGGSPFNVALGLARLARPVAFCGGVSTGFTGHRLLRALSEEGVATDCTVLIDAATTLSLVGLDASGVPRYAFYGAGCADRLLPLSVLDQIPAAAHAFHFGSYAMVVEPVASVQRALVERECRRSVIAYDPNLRLNVEPDVARWRDTLHWMLPRTHILKLSEEDFDLLHPGEDPARLARAWIAAGVHLVVLTRGSQGAWAWTAAHHCKVQPVKVPVVDTVGAGDTFQAAMLTALDERGLLSPSRLDGLAADTLAEVLGFAARAAAITCSRRGADLPRRAEVPLDPGLAGG